MKKILLFDFGDTLVGYCKKDAFPPVLKKCIAEAELYLREKEFSLPSSEEIETRTQTENFEAKDFQIRHLERRLERIFGLDSKNHEYIDIDAICEAFMKPFFAIARIYPDTIPALEKLDKSGYQMGIVSNTAWGSPAHFWRQEIARHHLNAFFKHIIFCRDAGCRKPAPPVFRMALEKFACSPEDYVFIGDRMDWDIEGARGVGIEAILIDREGKYDGENVTRITSLLELEDVLGRI